MVFSAMDQQQRNYYAVLGVHPNASPSELRSAYRKLAMKWHPDRQGRREPWIVAEANQRFQLIQEAYQVLSDENKRRLYDAALYNPFEDEKETEGFADFLQEMLRLMAQVRREGKQYSVQELQGMLVEMANSFEDWDSSSGSWFYSGGNGAGAGAGFPRSTKKPRCDSESQKPRRRSSMHLSGMEIFGSMR